MLMKRKIVAFIAAAGLAMLFLPALTIGDTESDDPVLNFYIDRARATAESRNPIERGTVFSFDAVTYYKRIGRGGKVDLVDSTWSTYYYSFGERDSLTTDTSVSSREYEVDIFYPNVFDHDYIYNFYPNDTGGADLAIGFDTDSMVQDEPVGIAIIDRSPIRFVSANRTASFFLIQFGAWRPKSGCFPLTTIVLRPASRIW